MRMHLALAAMALDIRTNTVVKGCGGLFAFPGVAPRACFEVPGPATGDRILEVEGAEHQAGEGGVLPSDVEV